MALQGTVGRKNVRKNVSSIARRLGILCVEILVLTTTAAYADQNQQQPMLKPPKNAFSVLNIFDGKLPELVPPRTPIIDVTTREDLVGNQASSSSSLSSSDAASETAPSQNSSAGNAATEPQFVNNDPKSHILPPDQDPRVRINAEAPGPFKAMAVAFQDGDKVTAKSYADQYVRYQVNLMFEARELAKLIYDSYVRQGLVDGEDDIGVAQYISLVHAKSRNDEGAGVKITHKLAMERIKKDPAGKAEIYVFFTLNCSFCRQMAPDVERLWQVVKGDPKLKMTTLIVGNHPKSWIDSYREYTGLTAPIMEGTEAAKVMKIGLVPAVVIVSPGNQVSYLKTGEQSFERLYEFVRTVQGLPAEPTPLITKLLRTPIGVEENSRAGRGGALWEDQLRGPAVGKPGVVPASDVNKPKREAVERF